jgi:hypothetical protein
VRTGMRPRRRACAVAVLVAAWVASAACDRGPGANRSPTTPQPSAGAPPLHEPKGLVGVNDNPWTALNGNGWAYTRRSASRNAAIVADTTAPMSPPDVLQIPFTTDMLPNSEPGANWFTLREENEIYTSWWMKLSSNWKDSPAGAGKITFLFTRNSGSVYTNLYHSPSSPRGAPYRIGASTNWAPYGQREWYPNVSTTPVYPGKWHRIEFYYRYDTAPGAGDGVIRWWVDGVLNGDYTNVSYPASPFVEFLFAPTLQDPPPSEQYMYIDHTYLSSAVR